MKDIIVIYHSADFDGIFCREIARKFFGDEADYVGWDYGDPLPYIPPHDIGGAPAVQLYMLDISIDRLMDYPGLVWIDHHKSAIDKFGNKAGLQIDGVAACRLAWQWFFTYNNRRNTFADTFASLPTKKDFVERSVSEPIAVRLAGEYDIWDKRDPRAEIFQHGLRSIDLDGRWNDILSMKQPTISDVEALHDVGHQGMIEPDGKMPPPIVWTLLENGRRLQYAKTEENESIAKHLAFTIQFESLCFCAINAARYNSHLFTAGIKPEHDALFGFNFDGKRWRVSLYHAPGKEHHDLSLIAVKHGGGGHRGACGFNIEKLPFLP